jgi:phage virion morphogenesis protein
MSGSDGLEALEPFLGELIASAEPGQRRKLIDKLMRAVRRANTERIDKNVEPDESAMVPRRARKVRKGELPRGKMFKNIGKANSLRIRKQPNEGSLYFPNPLSSYIAATHQYGNVAPVGKDRSGKVIRTKYDARRLLGFGKERDELVDEVLKHFGGT